MSDSTFLGSLGDFLLTPVTMVDTTGAAISEDTTTDPTMTALTGTSAANLGGYVSQDQKNGLIGTEATNLVQASGGSISQAAATAQATSDVTNALKQAGADPSQNPFNNPFGIDWSTLLLIVGVGLVVVAGLYIFAPRIIKGLL